MAKRARLTEMEAFAVKKRTSEPVGSRGMGSLLLERKASGVIAAYYRERTGTSDIRTPIGFLSKKPAPDTVERTLTELRSEALRVASLAATAGGLALYIAGQDDARAKALREQERLSRRGSFSDLMDAYVEHLERTGKVSVREVRQIFKTHVKDHYPSLIERAAAEIEPEDIQQILAGVLTRAPKGRGRGNKATPSASNGMRTTTDRLRRYLRAAFAYAAKAHLSPERLASEGKSFEIRSNPVRDIPVIRDAVRADTESLTPEEFAELLRYLRASQKPIARVMEVLIYLGGQRLRQACAVRWSDVAEDSLVIWDAKGAKAAAWPHVLPITSRIRQLMAGMLDKRLGLGPFSLVEGKALDATTLSKAFGVAGKSLAEAGKTPEFSWQNVRVTCETLLAAIGVSGETRAWLLSHGRSGVQAKHYDRYSYLNEKQAALEAWGRYLDNLHDGGPMSGNVVLLSKRSVN